MKFLANCTPKPIIECTKGELVRLPYGASSALAIILKQETETKHALIGYLAAPDDPASYFGLLDRTGTCLSFGLDWVIHPDLDSATSWPGNLTQQSGGLVLTPSGPALCFESAKRRPGAMVYTLLDSFTELNGDDRQYTPIPSWRLWATEADVNRTFAVPIFEKPAKRLS